MNATEVLDFLKRMAREAGSIMMDRIDGHYKVYEKPDHSRVTDVDLAISELLQNQVKAQLNGIRLYSEESPKQSIDRSQHYIIADELDGTSYYIDLQQGFSHQSAYYHPDHGLCAGLVYHPRIDTMIYAVKGKGAFIEEGGAAPIQVMPPPPKSLDELTFAHPLRYRGERYNDLYRKLGGDDKRILRTDARRTLMMARGELDVNIFLSPRIPYWDLSGEKVIVEELGYSHSYINRLPVEFGKPPPKPNLGYLICPEEWKEYFFTETPRLIS
jgi:fructose-1,6-bisphosphatase/inositol monophosphatase family enzyme